MGDCLRGMVGGGGMFGRTIVVSYEVKNVRGDGAGKDCGEAGDLETAVGASLDECGCLVVFSRFVGLCLDSRWVRPKQVSAIRFLVHIHIVF